ncbi:GNAT family N-acetyltransferase [Pseudalkalibacillus hwajinpoensis]|uniref:GNAT family N-acetyltransferase n=1 Tax=Guptibacillus hwajinpoensis TaxID=208199 RepID=UPI00325B7A6A
MIRLCLIQTPPHNLTIAGDRLIDEAIIRFAVEEIGKKMSLPGVLGERQLVERFSDHYSKLSNRPRKVHMNQRIYQLDKVVFPKQVQGTIRTARDTDHQLLTRWIREFTVAMGQPASTEESKERANQFIEEQSVVLWENNGQVVSMANQTRPTINGMTVNFVYTPPEFEKRGYASACVAKLSQSLLDRGYQFCSLYTDLSNPTSNSIYMKIGYRPVGDSTVFHFES